MDRSAIESVVQRVFADEWKYWSDEDDYFRCKRLAVRALAAEASALTGQTLAPEYSHKEINHHRVEIPMSSSKKHACRKDLRPHAISRLSKVVILDFTGSLIAPVGEAIWHEFYRTGHQLGVRAHALNSDELLRRHAKWRDIATAFAALAKKHGFELLPPEITQADADPSIPVVGYAIQGQAKLRDFLFPGHVTGIVEC